MRFRGVWTDGDVDEPVERHWVDNAFSPNQWQVFGSDVEPNVHAIGILTVNVALQGLALTCAVLSPLRCDAG